MRIETTDYNRRIKIVGIPPKVDGLLNEFDTLEILINYTGDSSAAKAIPLDNVIIPQIVASVNAIEAIGGNPATVAALAGALGELVKSRKVKMGPSAVNLRFDIAAAIIDTLPPNAEAGAA